MNKEYARKVCQKRALNLIVLSKIEKIDKERSELVKMLGKLDKDFLRFTDVGKVKTSLKPTHKSKYNLLTPDNKVVSFDNIAKFVRDNEHLFVIQYPNWNRDGKSTISSTPYQRLVMLINNKLDSWMGWRRCETFN